LRQKAASSGCNNLRRRDDLPLSDFLFIHELLLLDDGLKANAELIQQAAVGLKAGEQAVKLDGSLA
jgi:hypothetical protein